MKSDANKPGEFTIKYSNKKGGGKDKLTLRLRCEDRDIECWTESFALMRDEAKELRDMMKEREEAFSQMSVSTEHIF
jgi:hypothetical protein